MKRTVILSVLSKVLATALIIVLFTDHLNASDETPSSPVEKTILLKSSLSEEDLKSLADGNGEMLIKEKDGISAYVFIKKSATPSKSLKIPSHIVNVGDFLGTLADVIAFGSFYYLGTKLQNGYRSESFQAGSPNQLLNYERYKHTVSRIAGLVPESAILSAEQKTQLQPLSEEEFLRRTSPESYDHLAEIKGIDVTYTSHYDQQMAESYLRFNIGNGEQTYNFDMSYYKSRRYLRNTAHVAAGVFVAKIAMQPFLRKYFGHTKIFQKIYWYSGHRLTKKEAQYLANKIDSSDLNSTLENEVTPLITVFEVLPLHYESVIEKLSELKYQKHFF